MTIAVNQTGYVLSKSKYASTVTEHDGFSIINMNGSIVYNDKLSEAVFDESTCMNIKTADFSDFNIPGRYKIRIADDESYSFKISEHPYKEVKNALLKAFYYQRCGIELEEKYAGEYAHKECHSRLASLFDDQSVKTDVSGGWHDAGDYGRYSVAAASALGHMMYAYIMFPDSFNETINIPESKSGIPDILSECRFQYEWLLKMQADDGSVFHKVATRHFCGMIMPEDDTNELFVFSHSTCATASFCAVMAIGAGVYEKIDKAFADKMKLAALNSWNWLEKHPEFIEFCNPADISSGEYGCNTADEEIFWAGCELYSLTDDRKYLDKVLTLIDSIDLTEFGWKYSGGFGALSYLIKTGFGSDDLSVRLKNSFMQKADKLISIAEKSGFGLALASYEYYWGSNMLVMKNAMILIIAEKITGNTDYSKYILNLWDYLLGRNGLNISFISGFGENALLHPHHRACSADGVEKPFSGLVSGGPCSSRIDDHIMKLCPEGTPPALCYSDNEDSYSTNEIDIYWNSIALFTASYLDRE